MTTILVKPFDEQTIVEKLRIRAEIRRKAITRTSVREGKADRLAELLDEAAQKIDDLEQYIKALQQDNKELRRQIPSAQP